MEGAWACDWGTCRTSCKVTSIPSKGPLTPFQALITWELGPTEQCTRGQGTGTQVHDVAVLLSATARVEHCRHGDATGHVDTRHRVRIVEVLMLRFDDDRDRWLPQRLLSYASHTRGQLRKCNPAKTQGHKHSGVGIVRLEWVWVWTHVWKVHPSGVTSPLECMA